MEKNIDNKATKNDVMYDCGGVYIDASFFYREMGDNEGLKQYKKEMRNKGYVLSNGTWVPKECL